MESRKVVLDKAFKLYNLVLNKLQQGKKKKIAAKNRRRNLIHTKYKYERWFSEHEDEVEDKKSADIRTMPTLGDKRDVKHGTRIKILTPNKLFTGILVL